MTENAIEIRGLTKTYRAGSRRERDVHALQEMTLDVRPGEVFGLLGPNGAGKTTLVKILLGVVYPTSGSATILGTRIGKPSSRASVGYLPENHRYPDYLTGDGVMRYFGALSGMDGADRIRRTGELLELVNMTRWRGTRVRKYSKGMLQRIGLAQALLNNPSVVFLDEPTDGVDPIGRKEIRDIILRLRDEGKTIFLNSHLLSEVELISDRVAIMHKGKVLRIGGVREMTRTSEKIKIEVEGVFPADLVSPIAPTISVDGESATIEADTETLNRVIDTLRGGAYRIRSVEPIHVTLEEYFMSLIGEEERR